MKTWTVWLPPNTAQEALKEEAGRFGVLAKALAQDWSAHSDSPERSLKWISHVNSLFPLVKDTCNGNDANLAASTILNIILQSKHAAAAQMRWSGVLSNLLHTLRHKLTLTIDWRPLYHLMRHTFTDPLIGMEGALVVATRRRNMFDLCHSAQRFFAPGAAAEIWQELRPTIINVHQMEAFEALGWLSVFMPTQQAKFMEGQWNERAQEWLHLWESLAHSTMWNNTWMHLFSRLAKHDVGGAVDWAKIMPRLFTHILWAFPVPVGTATAQMPFGRHAPDIIQHLMTKEAPSAYKRAAKLAVYLLGQGGEGQSGSALTHLQRLIDLLEQYFHPSNGGSWTKSLASFLENFLFHLGKRIVAEKTSTAQPAPGSNPRKHLTGQDFDDITAMLMKPASKAQYSKDPHLMSCACYAMSQLAYLSPDQVLPLVFERFQAALTAVTATHQLVSAIHTLGLCIRPMLLANRPLRIGAAPDMMDTDTPEVPAGEALVNAMNATLPGIDANDEAKTLACFRFYCSALSCMGQLEAEPHSYPLYLSEWVEELMSRIFAILHNLDSPDTRTESAAAADAASTHSQSFLLHSESMFRPMAEMLMGRLPQSVAEQTIKQLARFLTTSTMPSVTSEAAVLANSAGWMHPELTAKHIIGPMLTRLESELEGIPTLDSSPAKGLSKTSEAKFEWLMGVLDAAIFRASGASLTFQNRLVKVLDVCFASASKVLQQSASHLLMAILEGLLGPYPVGQYTPAHALDRSQGMANGTADHEPAPPLEAWCTSSAEDPINTKLAPQWHTSTPAEVEFAEALLKRYVDDAAASLVSEPSHQGDDQAAQKERTRSLLLQIQGGLNGVHSRLPDCSPADTPSTGPSSLRMAGDVLPVGSPNTREKVIAALLSAHRHVSDPIILAKLVDALGNVISSGSHEYSEFSANFSAWKNDQRAVQEPAFGPLLTQGGNGSSAGGKVIWKRRRPRWLMVERAYLHLMFRTSQARFRWWLTVDRPKATLDIIPGPYKAAIAEIMKLSMHAHRPVRDSALRALDSSFKRYSCLLPVCLPTALCALAKLPLPEQPLQNAPSSLSPDGTVRLECLPALQQAMLDSGATSSHPEQLSASDAAQEEGMVAGAVSMLSCIPSSREICVSEELLAGLVAALMASSRFQTPRSQQAISMVGLTYCMRFMRPPALSKAQASGTEFPPGMRSVLAKLLPLSSGATDMSSPSGKLHWRFVSLANTILLLLLPPPTSHDAAQITGHFMSLLPSQLPSHRAISLAGLTYLFDLKIMERLPAEITTACRQALQASMGDAAHFGSMLMKQLIHSHPSPNQNGSGNSRMEMQARMSVDDALTTATASLLTRHRIWPQGSGRAEAILHQHFKIPHATLIQALGEAAPAEALLALAGPIKEALAGKQDADKPRTWAAAEALAGLLASGALFVPGPDSQSAWDSWACDLLRTVVRSAPLDLASVWSLSVRFGLHGLCEKQHASIGTLLELLAEYPAADAPTSAWVKHLRISFHAISELVANNLMGPVAAPCPASQAAAQLQHSFLDHLPQLLQIPQEAVRHQLARCVARLCASALMQPLPQPSSSLHPDADGLRSRCSSFLDNLISSVEADVEVITRHNQTHDAQALTDGSEDQPEGAAGQANGGVTPPTPMDVDDQEATTSASAPSGSSLDKAKARVGFAVQLVNRALRGGEGPVLASILIRLLPSLIRIQEMADPNLQQLAAEAKSSLALLKYLPLPPDAMTAAVSILQQAHSAEPWFARGAALVFCQYFWFRHCFLLSDGQMEAILQLAVTMLSDRKLEVAQLAALSLSGLLKALPAASIEALRQRYLDAAKGMKPAKRVKLSGPGLGKEMSLAEKHTLVLGLRAFVLSSPYDVPDWLPSILAALSGLASTPVPVKTTVRKTLGDFKRTHEEGGIARAKQLLGPDQWDSIQDIASPASYFA